MIQPDSMKKENLPKNNRDKFAQLSGSEGSGMFSGHSYSGNYSSPAPSNFILSGRQTTKSKGKEEEKGSKYSSEKKKTKKDKKKHKKKHGSSDGNLFELI